MPQQLLNVEEDALELGGDDGVGASEVGLMRARRANRDRLSDTVLMPSDTLGGSFNRRF